MAKIERVLQKLFGSTGPESDFGKFGSLAEGAPDNTKDPVEIQALARFLTGWGGAVIADNRPALEDENSLFLLAFRQLAYIFQAGIPEYEDDTVYYENSFCQVDGAVYKSVADDNTGNDPTTDDGSNWVVWQPPFQNNFLSGLNLSVASNVVTCSAGYAKDSTNTRDMTLPSSMAKNLGSTWVAGTGNGGLFAGSVANNTWYYFFLIRKDSDGSIDAGFDTSLTAANIPAGYTAYRRLGQFKTNGAATLYKVYQYGAGSYRRYIYDDYQEVINTATPSSSFADIDCSAFVPPVSTLITFNAKNLENNGAATVTTFYFRPKGSSGSGSIICKMIDGHGSGGWGQGLIFEIPSDSSQVIQYKSETQQRGILMGVSGYYDFI